MGLAIQFNKPAKALGVALELAAAGYGVLWRSYGAHVVMTSLDDREELRRIVRSAPLMEEWWRHASIDVGGRRTS